MRFNIPNKGISVPKITDEWPRKLITLAAMISIVYFAAPEFRLLILAIVAAAVYVNDEDLRVRACMINVMDHQLVAVSNDAAELRAQLDTMQTRISEIEFELSGRR